MQEPLWDTKMSADGTQNQTYSPIHSFQYCLTMRKKIGVYNAVCPHSTQYTALLWQTEHTSHCYHKAAAVWCCWYNGKSDFELRFNPRIIAVAEVWKTLVIFSFFLFLKRNASHYLYWAVTGPSCTGTRHRTPAVWQTHYRSSAFAHTGRSWRATSCALWKEGEG